MDIMQPFQQAFTWLKKQDGKTMLVWLGGVLIMLFVCLTLVWYAAGFKKITLIVDGEPTEIHTRLQYVSEVLEEQGIRWDYRDHISKPIYAEVQNDDRIEVDHAIAVNVVDGGEKSVRYTTASTVESALDEWNVRLGKEDEIHPALESELTEDTIVHIVRVERTIKEEVEPIYYKTVEVKDDQILKGKREVRQAGRDGKVVKKIEQLWKNGKLISQTMIDRTVEQESQDQIVAIGTHEPVQILSASSPVVSHITREDMTFGVKKVLENVTLTAYDAGYNSTGKTEDHPYYGITYTGSTVTEGRTVAVDPEVIPLGWWIYIDGIGFRRAEDIGSAIKGKKVDIYMESEDEANTFGRQFGHTIYVIGPEKPSA